MMTVEQKEKITEMRIRGEGYGTVAEALGIPIGTIKSFCRRNGLLGEGGSKIAVDTKTERAEGLDAVLSPKHERPEDMEFEGLCLSCGRPVVQIPGRRQKRFCCDKCRLGWWNRHRNLVQNTKKQKVRCRCCGRQFETMDGRDRKYCSHECYIKHRFGGKDGDSKESADDGGTVQK